jgi:hypothetical protein
MFWSVISLSVLPDSSALSPVWKENPKAAVYPLGCCVHALGKDDYGRLTNRILYFSSQCLLSHRRVVLEQGA